jgi:predicted site-specific integrase-resolvase
VTDTSLIPSAALARELGVNRRTLARWVNKGDTPLPRVLHGRLYFVRGEIEKWKKTWSKAPMGRTTEPCGEE